MNLLESTSARRALGLRAEAARARDDILDGRRAGAGRAAEAEVASPPPPPRRRGATAAAGWRTTAAPLAAYSAPASRRIHLRQRRRRACSRRSRSSASSICWWRQRARWCSLQRPHASRHTAPSSARRPKPFDTCAIWQSDVTSRYASVCTISSRGSASKLGSGTPSTACVTHETYRASAAAASLPPPPRDTCGARDAAAAALDRGRRSTVAPALAPPSAL